jgi:hypothetical protein
VTKSCVSCAYCGSQFEAERGAINRAAARNARVFCSRSCSGRARRIDATSEQRRAAKAEYDRQRRVKLADELRATKAEYHRRTYDPAKAAEVRKRRMPKHVEYCRRAEYRAWKAQYDAFYRAKKEYGEFAECHLIAMQIRTECLERATDEEIRAASGTLNKKLNRRREYERTHSNKPEIGALGNP